jgi:hypothetical protein
MIQMHGHQDHPQQSHCVKLRVSFLVSSKEAWYNLLGDVVISGGVERREVVEMTIDIHSCILPCLLKVQTGFCPTSPFQAIPSNSQVSEVQSGLTQRKQDRERGTGAGRHGLLGLL